MPAHLQPLPAAETKHTKTHAQNIISHQCQLQTHKKTQSLPHTPIPFCLRSNSRSALSSTQITAPPSTTKSIINNKSIKNLKKCKSTYGGKGDAKEGGSAREERGGRDSSERGESGGEEKGSHYWGSVENRRRLLINSCGMGTRGGTKKTKIREDWEEVLWSWERGFGFE